MHWPEATLEQYEKARQEVGWERDPAEGGLFHVAWFTAEGLRVIDIWDSPDSFQRFTDARLGPAVQKIGITGQPTVTFAPVHAIFNVSIPTAGSKAAARKPAARKAPARKAKAAKKAAPKKVAKKAAKKPAKKAAKPNGKKKGKR